MRLALVTVVAVVSIVTVGGVAQAQVQIQTGPSSPAVEFGVHINPLEAFGDLTRTVGGRVAKRHAAWLVSEFTYDRTRWTYENRESRLFVASARLQAPTTRLGKRSFVSLGIAKAGGMTFAWSPMVAAGAQVETPTGAGALRVEMQWFARGRSGIAWDRARLLAGLAIGIP